MVKGFTSKGKGGDLLDFPKGFHEVAGRNVRMVDVLLSGNTTKGFAMRLALISDTHFGDPLCTLINTTPAGRLVPGPRFKDFQEASGTNNDYLILLGDILDFAIQSYSRAYDVAREFFLMVQQERIARQMIYVPGNHDGDIWHIVEHQVNIIHQIERRRLPREFRMSLPGVLDLRPTSSRRRLMLPGVSERRMRGHLGYGGLFLDALTASGGRPTRFNFTYPNLYVVTDQGSVLLTHGHYFEPYWSLVSEWAPRVLGRDLAVHDPMLLKEMIALNFPLTQLACSGVGQAGPLTRIIYGIQADLAAKRLQALEGYLMRSEAAIMDSRLPEKAVVRRWIGSVLGRAIRSRLLKAVRSSESSRYNTEFIKEDPVRERFRAFFERSVAEIGELNRDHGLEIPRPETVIFGHTHQPVPWGSREAAVLGTEDGKDVRLFNTGGWLARVAPDGKEEFLGAEVFRYEPSSGWSSRSIR